MSEVAQLRITSSMLTSLYEADEWTYGLRLTRVELEDDWFSYTFSQRGFALEQDSDDGSHYVVWRGEEGGKGYDNSDLIIELEGEPQPLPLGGEMAAGEGGASGAQEVGTVLPPVFPDEINTAANTARYSVTSSRTDGTKAAPGDVLTVHLLKHDPDSVAPVYQISLGEDRGATYRVLTFALEAAGVAAGIKTIEFIKVPGIIRDGIPRIDPDDPTNSNLQIQLLKGKFGPGGTSHLELHDTLNIGSYMGQTFPLANYIEVVRTPGEALGDHYVTHQVNRKYLLSESYNYGNVEYEWYKGQGLVHKSAGNTYRIQDSDIVNQISVRVVYTDTAGNKHDVVASGSGILVRGRDDSDATFIIGTEADDTFGLRPDEIRLLKAGDVLHAVLAEADSENGAARTEKTYLEAVAFGVKFNIDTDPATGLPKLLPNGKSVTKLMFEYQSVGASIRYHERDLTLIESGDEAWIKIRYIPHHVNLGLASQAATTVQNVIDMINAHSELRDLVTITDSGNLNRPISGLVSGDIAGSGIRRVPVDDFFQAVKHTVVEERGYGEDPTYQWGELDAEGEFTAFTATPETTAITYTLRDSDFGANAKQIAVRVTYVDGDDYHEVVTSEGIQLETEQGLGVARHIDGHPDEVHGPTLRSALPNGGTHASYTIGTTPYDTDGATTGDLRVGAELFAVLATPDLHNVEENMIAENLVFPAYRWGTWDLASGLFTAFTEGAGASETKSSYRLKHADIGEDVAVEISYTDSKGIRSTVIESVGIPIPNEGSATYAISTSTETDDIISDRIDLEIGDTLYALQTSQDPNDLAPPVRQVTIGSITFTLRDPYSSITHIVPKGLSMFGADPDFTPPGPGETEYYLRASPRITAADVAHYFDETRADRTPGSYILKAEITGSDTLWGFLLLHGSTPDGAETPMPFTETEIPITYQWRRDGIDIDGATDSHYELTADDIDKDITVVVSYKDGITKDEVVTSNSVEVGLELPETPTTEDPNAATFIIGLNPNDTDGLNKREQESLKDFITIYAVPTAEDPDDVGKSFTPTYKHVWGVINLDGDFEPFLLRPGVFAHTSPSYHIERFGLGEDVAVRISYTDSLGNAHEVITAPVKIRHAESARYIIEGDGDEPLSPIAGDVVTVKLDLPDSQNVTPSEIAVDVAGITFIRTESAQNQIRSIEVRNQEFNSDKTQNDVTHGQRLRIDPNDSTNMILVVKEGETIAQVVAALSSDASLNPYYAWINASATGTPSDAWAYDDALGGTNLFAYRDFALAPNTVSETYQWGTTDVHGNFVAFTLMADGQSYTVTEDNLGKAIVVRVSYEDSVGNSHVVTETIAARANTGFAIYKISTTQDESGVIAKPRPYTTDEVLYAIEISDDPEGRASDSTTSFQWTKNGVDIVGADKDRYTVQDGDENISVRISYKDAINKNEIVTDQNPVTYPADSFVADSMTTATYTISHSRTDGLKPIAGDVLTINLASDDPQNAGGAKNMVAPSFDWGEVNEDGSFTRFGGELGETYTVTSGDIGKHIAALVRYTDSQGNKHEILSASTPLRDIDMGAAVYKIGTSLPDSDGVTFAEIRELVVGESIYANLATPDPDNPIVPVATTAEKYSINGVTFTIQDAARFININAIRFAIGDTPGVVAPANQNVVTVTIEEQHTIRDVITVFKDNPILKVELDENFADSIYYDFLLDYAFKDLGQLPINFLHNFRTVTEQINEAQANTDVSYQWTKNGMDIGGAHFRQYILESGDLDTNTRIGVKVTYTDGEGHQRTVTSSLTEEAETTSVLPEMTPATYTISIDPDQLRAPTTDENRALDVGDKIYAVQTSIDPTRLTDAAPQDGFAVAGIIFTKQGASGSTRLTVIANHQQNPTVSVADIAGIYTVYVSHTFTIGEIIDILNDEDRPNSLTRGHDLLDAQLDTRGNHYRSNIFVPDNDDITTNRVNLPFVNYQENIPLTVPRAATYEWTRDGVAIPNSNNSIYTLTDEDLGKEISFKVTYDYTDNDNQRHQRHVESESDLTIGSDIVRFAGGSYINSKTLTPLLIDRDGDFGTTNDHSSSGYRNENGRAILLEGTSGHINNPYELGRFFARSKEGFFSYATNDELNTVFSLTENEKSLIKASHRVFDLTNNIDAKGKLDFIGPNAGESVGDYYELVVKFSLGGEHTYHRYKINLIPETRSSFIIDDNPLQSDGVTEPIELTIGDTLHALESYIDTHRDLLADGTPAPAGYQWLRDGAAILGAHESSYSLTYDDFGAAISVQVSYDYRNTKEETVTSGSVQLNHLAVRDNAGDVYVEQTLRALTLMSEVALLENTTTVTELGQFDLSNTDFALASDNEIRAQLASGRFGITGQMGQTKRLADILANNDNFTLTSDGVLSFSGANSGDFEEKPFPPSYELLIKHNATGGSVFTYEIYEVNLADVVGEAPELIPLGATLLTEQKIELTQGILTPQGIEITLNESMLPVRDDDPADNIDFRRPIGERITYTLETISGSNSIKVNGSPIAVDGTFTLKQLREGEVVFMHDGEGNPPSFSLSVADSDGNTNNQTQTYNVIIPQTDPSPPPLPSAMHVHRIKGSLHAAVTLEFNPTKSITNATHLANVTFDNDPLGTKVVTLSNPNHPLFEIKNGTEIWVKGGLTIEHRNEEFLSTTLLGTGGIEQEFTLGGDVINRSQEIYFADDEGNRINSVTWHRFDNVEEYEAITNGRIVGAVKLIDPHDGFVTGVVKYSPTSSLFTLRMLDAPDELIVVALPVLLDEYKSHAQHQLHVRGAIDYVGIFLKTGDFPSWDDVRDKEDINITINVVAVSDVVEDSDTTLTWQNDAWSEPEGYLVKEAWRTNEALSLTVGGTDITADDTVVSTNHGSITVDTNGYWEYALSSDYVGDTQRTDSISVVYELDEYSQATDTLDITIPDII